MNSRFILIVPAVAAAVFVANSSAVAARNRPSRPEVGSIETPLGAQSGDIVLAFRLDDPTRRPCDVEVQYGYDRNGDGRITDGTETVPSGASPFPNEYSRATEDRLDPRDTRKNRSPQLFTTAGGIGATHAFVWKSFADLRHARLATTEYKLDLQGRKIADPANPGSFLFATGPDGSPFAAGVRVRMRAVQKRGGNRRTWFGAWAISGAFDLDNSGTPSMTIDAIAPSTDAPTTILVDWTLVHPDSEDKNGNGQLDVAGGEDQNGNAKLDVVRCGVAFDWHHLVGNENPATMTTAQLDALAWSPCDRAVGVGDTDSLDARPGVAVPTTGDLAGVIAGVPGLGRSYVFAWDTAAQFGETFPTDGFILRATPFDQNRNHGATVYSRVVIRPAQ